MFSLRFLVTSFLLPIFLQETSRIDRQTTPFPSLFICASACNTIQQPFITSGVFCLSVSLSLSEFWVSLLFCQVVLLVLTWKQARACAGVRQIETDEPSVCWTAAHASPYLTPWRCLKKATRLNIPAKTFFTR